MVMVSSSGLIFSFAAVRLSFLSLTTLHSLFPAVLIEPDAWGAHSLRVAHLKDRKTKSKWQQPGTPLNPNIILTAMFL